MNDILANLHIHTMSYLNADQAAAQQMRKIAGKRIVELAGNLSNLHDEHFGKK